MSNVYGFDFLKNDHKPVEEDGSSSGRAGFSAAPIGATSSFAGQDTIPIPSTTHKSDLEKQHDVIEFLKNHRLSGCLQPGVIYNRLGVDLSEGGEDEAVRKMLLNNKLIKVEEEPDPENPSLTIYTFGYQAKFHNVRNKTGLLAQINKSKYGIRRKDLLDSYEGVKDDINMLITGGEIIAIPNSEDKDNPILLQRGEPFFVELDGHITSPSSNYNPFLIETDGDTQKQIRRGEAIWVGGQWFRVSSAIKEGVPLSEQPQRAQAPKSATSNKDLSKKNDADGYIRPYTNKLIPLDHALEADAVNNIHQGKQALSKLHKIASAGGRGVTGGASAQLLSSNATSDNFEALVDKFAFTTGQGSSSARRRPTSNRNHFFHSHQGQKKKAVSSHLEEATKAAKDPSLIYCHARRHGCTLDVRDLYLKTVNEIPLPENEVEIFKLMIQYKLLDKNSKMKNPRMSEENKNLDKDGRPMKRRYYIKKSDQLRNDHLKDTAIGELLQAALDKQQQGKAVGDGGM